MLASYEADFAATHGRAAREILEAAGPRFFGVRLRQDSTAANHWMTKAGGGMSTAGVGGPLTGKGADLLLIDDPIKNWQEANSETIREHQWDWFRSTAYTRLEPGGSAVIIMTRWHEDDLVGRILADEEIGHEWEVIELPAVVTEDDLPDPLGRGVGDPLWASRYDADALDSIRKNVGPYIWSALYQGKPAPPEGNLFKREGMRYWTPLVAQDADQDVDARYNLGGLRVVDPSTCFRMAILDPAVTEKTENDPTVVGTFDLADRGDIILKSLRRRRVEGPDLVPLLWSVYRDEHPQLIGVETKSFQLTVFQQAKREGLPMVELKPDLDKIARAQRAIARHAAGQLWFEKDADYLEKLEYELLKFPRAAHDDQVDVISYAAIEADKRAFDWDEAYGIKVCDQCGERYLRNPQNRCDKCGAED
jgi:predicted phage terminase large subunit-like protein